MGVGLQGRPSIGEAINEVHAGVQVHGEGGGVGGRQAEERKRISQILNIDRERERDWKPYASPLCSHL